MKRIIALGSIGVFVTAISIFYFKISPDTLSTPKVNSLSPAAKYKELYKNVKEKEERNEEGIKDADAYIQSFRVNPKTGKIDHDEMLRVRNEVALRRSNRSSRNFSLDLEWEFIGPNNVGGRTRSLIIDNQNPDRMYAGSVTGGLYVSDNGALSWYLHPDNSKFKYVGIGAIAQASNGDIYVGTGESYPGSLQIIGSGIYKSSDRGQTFEHLVNTEPQPGNAVNDDWSYVNEIAIDPNDPNIVYAATGRPSVGAGGLQVSYDGGQTWTEATLDAPTNNSSRDVVMGSNGFVHAEINSKYYRKHPDSSFFELRSGKEGFPGSSDISRIKFAVAPSDPNYVYAVAVNKYNANPPSRRDALYGVYKSTDAGETWIAYSPVNSSSFNPCGDQGNYDLALGVDAGNKDKVWVGGQLELMAGGNDVGWDLVAYWSPKEVTNPYYVHADMHCVVFHPTDPTIAFVATDGGIFKSTNAHTQFPTFTERNKGYSTVQFYHISASPVGKVMGGAQDNGTSYVNFSGNTPQSAYLVQGGDGGFTAISWIYPDILFTEVQNGDLRRSVNDGEGFSCLWGNDQIVADPNVPCGPIGGPLFIAPYTLWEKIDTVVVAENYTLQDSMNLFELIESTSPVPDTLIERFTGFTDSVQYLATGDSIKLSTLSNVADVYSHKFEPASLLMFGSGSNRVFLTPDAINLSGTLRWFEIILEPFQGRIPGTVTTIESSPNGTFYIGTNTGFVYRIDNLPNYNFPTQSARISNNVRQNTTRLAYPPFSIYDGTFGESARQVTGIGINPNRPNDVVVTLGNYGFEDYVFYSDKALTLTDATPATPSDFRSIQGDLPHFPVWDAMIDYYNRSNIIIGTDLGVWASTDRGQTWHPEDDGMINLPVFTVMQNILYDTDCQVIYAGTYGGGAFRSTTLVKQNRGEAACNTTPNNPPLVGIDDIHSNQTSIKELSLYPNPVRDKAIIEFNLDGNAEVTVQVIDMMGRLVKTQEFGKRGQGSHRLEADFQNILSGIYIVNLKIDDKHLTKRVFVTK